MITDFQSRIKSFMSLKSCIYSETFLTYPHNARASLTIIDNIISYMKKVMQEQFSGDNWENLDFFSIS